MNTYCKLVIEFTAPCESGSFADDAQADNSSDGISDTDGSGF